MTARVQNLGDPEHLFRLIEDPDAIDDPVLSFFLGYWRAAGNGRDVPLRSSFVPQEVRGHLQWVVTADALPDDSDFRFRVVGTRVCDYFLHDGQGKTVSEAFAHLDHHMKDGTLWMFRHACRERVPLRITGPSSQFKDIYFPAYDALCLPYSSDGEKADRIVYALTYIRDARQAPGLAVTG